MCSKRRLCPKCNWEKVTEWGNVKLCQCDLKEVADACKSIRSIKVPNNSYFKETIKAEVELPTLILKDLEALLDDE